MNTQALKHGDMVTVTALLKRGSAESAHYGRYVKKWSKEEHPAIAGVFLGFRTLANGERAHNGIDEPPTFIPKEYIRVPLVSVSPRRNPVYVPLDSISPCK